MMKMNWNEYLVAVPVTGDSVGRGVVVVSELVVVVARDVTVVRVVVVAVVVVLVVTSAVVVVAFVTLLVVVDVATVQHRVTESTLLDIIYLITHAVRR